MHILTLIIIGGAIAVALQLLVLDGIAGWIASRIILQPWQHDSQVRAIRCLYAFAYSTCLIVWASLMINFVLPD